MDAARELAKLGERSAEVARSLPHERLRGGRVGREARLGEPQNERQRDKALLCAVMEIPLEAPALGVAGLDESHAGVTELRLVALCSVTSTAHTSERGRSSASSSGVLDQATTIALPSARRHRLSRSGSGAPPGACDSSPDENTSAKRTPSSDASTPVASANARFAHDASFRIDDAEKARRHVGDGREEIALAAELVEARAELGLQALVLAAIPVAAVTA